MGKPVEGRPEKVMAMHGAVERDNKPDAEIVAGKILSLIASGEARSRLELAEVAGLSRSTIAERLAVLLKGGFVEERIEAQPGRGRPTRQLELNKNFAVVLAADIGETYAHLAVTDLRPAILAETGDNVDIHNGPESMLTWIVDQFRRLLASLSRTQDDVLGVGLGLPAQIDFEAGRVVAPSLMTGWEDFDIRGWLRGHLDAPVVVENEVNLMAISEHHRFWRNIDHLFFVKAGTGIGSGIIASGRIYRGARGAAGEIGHIQVDSVGGPLCRCGKLGCLESRASGWALARDLRELGIPVENARGVVALVKANRPEAIQRVREAGRILGKVIADIGCVLNPGAIIVGGALSRAEDHFMVGLRELLYQRSLPFATRGLIVETARAEPETCVLLGAAQVVIETQLGAECVDQTLRRHWGGPRPADGRRVTATA
jgi:predicted NBD/HSP70 family sugar kinase